MFVVDKEAFIRNNPREKHIRYDVPTYTCTLEWSGILGDLNVVYIKNHDFF
jgi:hypothetical protein